MKNQVSWAITVISSDNQNISAVKAIAEELGAVIPSDGQWSGASLSRRGTSSRQSAVSEIIAYCEKHFPRVKYLIIGKPDRFMRSVKEALYLESELKRLGVKICSVDRKDLS